MKKLFIIVAFALPLTSQAVCFGSFQEEGYGVSQILAASDADKKADVYCGSDEFNWKSRKGTFTYTDYSTEQVVVIQAKATYQCCTQW